MLHVLKYLIASLIELIDEHPFWTGSVVATLSVIMIELPGQAWLMVVAWVMFWALWVFVQIILSVLLPVLWDLACRIGYLLCLLLILAVPLRFEMWIGDRVKCIRQRCRC